MDIEFPTSFVSLLTIVFIALKLMGYISWSWLWVLSPIFINLALLLLVVLIMLLAELF